MFTCGKIAHGCHFFFFSNKIILKHCVNNQLDSIYFRSEKNRVGLVFSLIRPISSKKEKVSLDKINLSPKNPIKLK